MNHGSFSGAYSATKSHDTFLIPAWKLVSTAWFRFTDDPSDPLTFTDAKKFKWRTGDTYLTDKGSIPWWLRWLYPHDRFERAYYFHDFACANGYLMTEDGLAVKISRLRADQLLREMVLALGARKSEAAAIYRGVRIGALLEKVGTKRKGVVEE